MITLLDYGAGNVRSVVNAIESLGETDRPVQSPEDILSAITTWFARQQPWTGKKVLITAGPTYEPIDPVRFIGNHSSGRMGFELAEAAAAMPEKPVPMIATSLSSLSL